MKSIITLSCSRSCLFLWFRSLFYFCFRKDLSNLEDISKTQLTCAWSNKKGSVREKSKAVPIKDMLCIQVKESVVPEPIDDVVREKYFMFTENFPNSTIAILRNIRMDVRKTQIIRLS